MQSRSQDHGRPHCTAHGVSSRRYHEIQLRFACFRYLRPPSHRILDLLRFGGCYHDRASQHLSNLREVQSDAMLDARIGCNE